MKKITLLLGVLNTIAIAAVLGLFVYTKMVFKRPAITEHEERAKLVANANKLDTGASGKKMIIQLDPITVNLDTFKDKDGKEVAHYASVSLAIEIRDEKDAARFNDVKAVIMDQIIQNLGKKKFEELNQVQGRYLFRSQIIDSANDYLKKPVVTEVYFSDFLLQ